MALDRCAPGSGHRAGLGGRCPNSMEDLGFSPPSLDALPGVVPAGCSGAEPQSSARLGAKRARDGEGGLGTQDTGTLWGMSPPRVHVAAETSPLHSTCDIPNASRAWRPDTILEASSPLCLQPHPFPFHRAPVTLLWLARVPCSLGTAVPRPGAFLGAKPGGMQGTEGLVVTSNHCWERG